MARSTAGVADEGALITLTADITKAEDCERVANAVLDRFGRVDALVNAAGIGMQTVRSNYMSEPVRFWEVEPDRWQAVMDVNWKGAFLMARAVTPHLVKQGSGRIVNVTTSLDTMFRGAYTPYGMSKAALEAATASWAKDLEGHRRHRQRAGARRSHQHELHPRERTLRPQQAGATRGHGRAHPVARVRRVPRALPAAASWATTGIRPWSPTRPPRPSAAPRLGRTWPPRPPGPPRNSRNLHTPGGRPDGPFVCPSFPPPPSVIPAKAGIQVGLGGETRPFCPSPPLDSRFRGNDGRGRRNDVSRDTPSRGDHSDFVCRPRRLLIRVGSRARPAPSLFEFRLLMNSPAWRVTIQDRRNDP